MERVFIFTNLDYYPSKAINNSSIAVRVGQINTSTDSYSLLSNSGGSDPNSLPGRRRDFTTATLNNMIYLFGGSDGSADFDDYHAFMPGSGFAAGGTIPPMGTQPGPRSGAAAATASGKIYLFGGRQGNNLLNQAVSFDGTTFTLLPAMGWHFYNGSTAAKTVAGNDYIYIVGAREVSDGAPVRTIYRYNIANAQLIRLLDSATSQPLQIPHRGTPLIALDPSGDIRIIAAEESGTHTWGAMDVWTLQDTYGGAGDGVATLTADPYSDPARARNNAGALACGSAIYLIGGDYGRGPSLEDRSRLVDKLVP